ncbi:MAG: hypothetical protein HY349_00935 [Nitrospirae bacterium]|nr:hypothetical protein [Nitrospirota bacterium]
MKCPRCKGWMVQERMQDVRDDTGQISFEAWHCLACGEILDPVILSNRQLQPKPIRHGNRNLLVYN